MSSDAQDLLVRLAGLAERVRALVEARLPDDPAPTDPFRGLYLSAADVERTLAPRPSVPAAAPGEPLGERSRSATLAAAFGLDALDVALLSVVLAPDVEPRFERLYAYLNDDVSRRRATVGLALELYGLSAADSSARARLAPGSPLVDGGLVEVEDGDRPFLTRSLRVPDRVTGYLLGDDRADAALAAVLREPATYDAGDAAALSRALRRARVCYLRERPGSGARAFAAAALRGAGLAVLDMDLSRLPAGPELSELARVLGREARLRGAGVVAGPVVEQAAESLRALCDQGVPVLLTGTVTWDPRWLRSAPLLVEAPELGRERRRALWRAHLDGQAGPGLDPAGETEHLRLGPEQILRTAEAATASGEPVTPDLLLAGARAQNAAGLERLARRIVPAVGWSQLVLPDEVAGRLRELSARARCREQVLGDWAMRPGGARGLGVTALFTGEPGTGKTTAAEVIAADLGLDLYAVDLSSVVDKYVGETEKNLERIFAEAAGVNGVLLFDEADALFGKRSAVGDAHDRYANIETAYLLQRMETFDGLVVLATNLRGNLDEAFTRRLDLVVDFPVPDEGMRRRLWDVCLGTRLPRADDVDLDLCAKAFDLAGGDIRSAAVTAAYHAATAGRPVRMADLVRAVEAEYRKLGRLRLAGEFDRRTEARAEQAATP